MSETFLNQINKKRFVQTSSADHNAFALTLHTTGAEEAEILCEIWVIRSAQNRARRRQRFSRHNRSIHLELGGLNHAQVSSDLVTTRKFDYITNHNLYLKHEGGNTSKQKRSKQHNNRSKMKWRNENKRTNLLNTAD